MKVKRVIKSLSVFVLIVYIAVTTALFPVNEPVHTPEHHFNSLQTTISYFSLI